MALLEAVDKLRQRLSEACELEVLQHATRNYNALSPLVLLRRDGQSDAHLALQRCGGAPTLG